MIKISSLYDKFKGMVNEHHNGAVPIGTWIDWVNDTQRIIFEELISEFQKTQVISDFITPFLESKNGVVKKQPGLSYDLISKPTGYEHLASCRILKIGDKSCGCKSYDTIDGDKKTSLASCGSVELDEDELQKLKDANDEAKYEIKVAIVDNDRWSAILNHPRKKITKDKPAITQFAGGFKIAPRNSATSVIMDFFVAPKDCVFNYNIINPGTEAEYLQFNPTGSVNLDWSESLTQKFLDILNLKYNTFVGK